jgi:hypothetical protein
MRCSVDCACHNRWVRPWPDSRAFPGAWIVGHHPKDCTAWWECVDGRLVWHADRKTQTPPRQAPSPVARRVIK